MCQPGCGCPPDEAFDEGEKRCVPPALCPMPELLAAGMIIKISSIHSQEGEGGGGGGGGGEGRRGGGGGEGEGRRGGGAREGKTKRIYIPWH